MQELPTWSSYYSSKVLPMKTQPRHSQPMLPNATATTLYQQALTAAAEVSRHSVSCDLRHKRHNIMQELQSFLTGPLASLHKDIHTCTPEDIIVFMQAHYIEQYKGSKAGNDIIAALKSVHNVVSALRKGFREIERCRAWDETRQQGNPAHSHYDPIGSWI